MGKIIIYKRLFFGSGSTEITPAAILEVPPTRKSLYLL